MTDDVKRFDAVGYLEDHPGTSFLFVYFADDYDTMKTRLRALLVRWLEDPKSSREAIRLAIDTAKELEDSHE